MIKFWSTAKSKVSKNHLRQIKNSLSDDFDYIKYHLGIIKGNIVNKPGSTESHTKISANRKKDALKIVFTVSEYGTNASTGDYFTAMEFGEGLKKLGWQISFLSKKGSKYWYEVDDDVDILISLLDIYDPRRIRSSNKSLLKIAWPRNWFDRWVSHPGFSDYDLVFAPSLTAVKYIEENSDKKAHLLPIATNNNRFNDGILPKNEYLCDCCFTGSYWNYPREIMDMLEPEEIPYKFKLYGKNWDKIDKFKKYYQGFINYSELPEIYASTKIVIDDANTATKQYGAVNSRVFDALACGALILTNGEKGANETFKGKLPVFKSKEELKFLIEYYLSNEDIRTEKIEELQKFVLENHTYNNRAKTLNEVLKKEYFKPGSN